MKAITKVLLIILLFVVVTVGVFGYLAPLLISAASNVAVILGFALIFLTVLFYIWMFRKFYKWLKPRLI